MTKIKLNGRNADLVGVTHCPRESAASLMCSQTSAGFIFIAFWNVPEVDILHVLWGTDFIFILSFSGM